MVDITWAFSRTPSAGGNSRILEKQTPTAKQRDADRKQKR